MLSRDQIKEGRVSTFGTRHDLLPADTNLEVTEFFFAATSSFLQADISLVVEAAFQHKVWVGAVAQWSRIADVYFIVCQVDPAVAARRHLDRGLGDPTREFYHGDNRVKVFRETGEFLPADEYEPPAVDLPTHRHNRRLHARPAEHQELHQSRPS